MPSAWIEIRDFINWTLRFMNCKSVICIKDNHKPCGVVMALPNGIEPSIMKFREFQIMERSENSWIKSNSWQQSCQFILILTWHVRWKATHWYEFWRILDMSYRLNMCFALTATRIHIISSFEQSEKHIDFVITKISSNRRLHIDRIFCH